jgi:serine/threonine protein kinase
MHPLRSFLLATALVGSSLGVPLGPQDADGHAIDASLPSPVSHDVGPLEARGLSKIKITEDHVTYTIYPHEELGRGAFGIVYSAEINPGNGRPVAVKIVESNKDMLAGPDDLRSRIRDWTNIIKVKSFGIAGPKQVLVMEKADPRDLEQWIQKGTFARHPDVLRTDFMGMVRGLAVMHSKNLAHNDAHSGNVVFVDGVTKLTDFDLITKGQYQDRICGRVDIKGPEALGLTHSSSIDAFKNDVWGAGITLYRMITGTNPWNRASDDLARHIWTTPSASLRAQRLKKYLPSISSEVCEVLSHVFCPQRERYTATEFWHAVSAVSRFQSSRAKMTIRAEPSEEGDLDTPENYICSFNPGNGTATSSTKLRMSTRTSLYQ